MRRAALLALCLAGCSPSNEPTVEGRTVSRWQASLDSALPAERQKACDVMGQFGLAAADSAERVGELLGDANEDVKGAAARALPKLGPKGRAAAETALAKADLLDRFYAAVALVNIDPTHDKAAEILLGTLAGVGNERMSERARDAVVKIGAPLVPRLGNMLEDPYAPVRVQVLVALGGVGAAARPVTDAVAAQLKHADGNVRVAALKALARIGPKETVVPLIAGCTADPDERVAGAANDMLTYFPEPVAGP